MSVASRPLRISVIAGACVERDAISEAVRGSIIALQSGLGAEVCLFTYANDFPGYPVKLVSGIGDILLDPFYLESDIILYSFGIWYEMFGALLVGNGKARQIVRFHNVTPKAFLPQSAHTLADKSVRQISLVTAADVILADSDFNKADLVRLGISPDVIDVVQLYVKFDTPRCLRKAEATARSFRILYVGRFVESKGVSDLIDALGQVSEHGDVPFTLTMAGNVSFSDAGYIAKIRAKITDLGLEERVQFAPDVTDTQLRQLYEAADVFVMPSYHEGFCVPVLEALHAGCVPVTSTAGNLPNLVGDLGVTFTPGDATALARALIDLGQQFRSGRPETLRLAARRMSWSSYEAKVGKTLQKHTFDVFARRMVSVVRSLMSPAKKVRPDQIGPTP